MLSDNDKDALRKIIKSNTHEVFIVSLEQMDEIVCSAPQYQQPAFRARWDTLKGGLAKREQPSPATAATSIPSAKEVWKDLKGAAGIGANFTASADDTILLGKLIADLGGVGAQAYVKSYGGKLHIILKGRPGLRKVLTGTKYGVKNAKVVSMGLGKAGAVKAARAGGILTIVLLSAYRVVDYFLTDEATLSQLVGSLATDVVKVGITAGAAMLAATGMAATTLAIGPLVAVVVVGVGVSVALDELDRHYGITDKVISALDELGDDVDAYIDRKQQALLNRVGDAVEDAAATVIQYAARTAQKMAVDFIKENLRKFPPIPRL